MSKVATGRTVRKMTEQTVEAGLKILNEFRWLTDAYIVDFFVEDLWGKVPKNWREAFETENLETLADFINFSSDFRQKSGPIWPLSLLALRSCCKLYSANQKPISGTKKLSEVLFHGKELCGKNQKWLRFHEVRINKSGHNGSLVEPLRANVKPKKQHEIRRISDIVSVLRTELNFDFVVDVGSGLGHLSRVISAENDLKVVAVEGNKKFVDKAIELDAKFRSKIRKCQNSHVDAISLPEHNAKFVNLDQSSGDGLNGFLPNASNEKFCLLGLHTCGDLAAALVREFATNSKISAIVSLGCCYMKLNGGLDKENRQVYDNFDAENIENHFGYPLSNFVKSNSHHTLSYTAREVACHALNQYINRLKSGKQEILKVHCYRAILECIILKKYPEKRKQGLHGVKNAHKLRFEDYCAKAVAKRQDLSCVLEALDDFEIKEFVKSALDQWERVVTVYSLRLMLAPLVETVILYDRVLYLREWGLRCELVPVFDPTVSPRNLALIAYRKKFK